VGTQSDREEPTVGDISDVVGLIRDLIARTQEEKMAGALQTILEKVLSSKKDFENCVKEKAALDSENDALKRDLAEIRDKEALLSKYPFDIKSGLRKNEKGEYFCSICLSTDPAASVAIPLGGTDASFRCSKCQNEYRNPNYSSPTIPDRPMANMDF
jgi:hypothetical protein